MPYLQGLSVVEFSAVAVAEASAAVKSGLVDNSEGFPFCVVFPTEAGP